MFDVGRGVCVCVVSLWQAEEVCQRAGSNKQLHSLLWAMAMQRSVDESIPQIVEVVSVQIVDVCVCVNSFLLACDSRVVTLLQHASRGGLG